MTQVAVKEARQDSVDVLKVIMRSPVYRDHNAARTVQNWWTVSDKVWAGMVDGEIACLWGLAPPSFLADNAHLWLLTTDLVENHKFLFVRHSQRWMEQVRKVYPLITGHTESTNLAAIRWIRWLGGEFGPPVGGYRAFTIEGA
jgi:hypothetical protein